MNQLERINQWVKRKLSSIMSCDSKVYINYTPENDKLVCYDEFGNYDEFDCDGRYLWLSSGK